MVEREHRDLTHALAHHTRQIEPCPEVAAVRAHPAIVRWDGVRPVPPQQFAPVDRGLCRSFQSPVESGRNLSRMLGNRRSLVDRYVPLPRLFLSCRGILVRRRRIEHLTDSALGSGSGRFICVARGLLVGIRSIPSWLVLFLLAAAILLGFRFKYVVDLLRAHSTKAVVEKDSLGQAESRVNEQRIDGEIACHIPPLWIATRAPHMMVQRRMHDLMSQRSRQGRSVERFNELRIVVERHSVGRHGFNGPTLQVFQSKQKRAEEGMVEHQSGARLLNAARSRCFTSHAAAGASMNADMRVKMSSAVWPTAVSAACRPRNTSSIWATMLAASAAVVTRRRSCFLRSCAE